MTTKPTGRRYTPRSDKESPSFWLSKANARRKFNARPKSGTLAEEPVVSRRQPVIPEWMRKPLKPPSAKGER